MSSGGDAALAVGDMVRFVDMADASMNGVTGELIKPVGKDRWVVSPTGGEGGEKTKVVSRKCLQKLDVKQEKKGGSATQPCMYSIVGTWDDWEVHEMRWNAELQSFEYPVTIGSDGKESFKMLLDGDWDTCLHPDRHNASPRDSHTLQGPDDGGLDEEWTIGHHPQDEARPGAIYKVRLLMGANGREKAVSWEREEPVPPAAVARPSAPETMAAADDGPKYHATRPTMPWRVEAPTPQEFMDAGEAMERAEREARKRLERRLAAAAEAELLPIEDARGYEAKTVGALSNDWEAMLRRRKLKDAKARYEEAFKAAEPEEPAEPVVPAVGQPQEGTPPGEQNLKQCIECGSETPYQRCSACLLLRVHKGSWKPASLQSEGPGGNITRAARPADPREAFDQAWTFK